MEIFFLAALLAVMELGAVSGKKNGAPAGNRNAKKQPKNNPRLQPRNDPNIEKDTEKEIDIDTAPNERGRKRTSFLFGYRTGWLSALCGALWQRACGTSGRRESGSSQRRTMPRGVQGPRRQSRYGGQSQVRRWFVQSSP